MANKLTTYLTESAEELKKVTWPTKKDTYSYTMLVIGVSIAVSLFLGLLDFIFSKGLEKLINRVI
jgi:preprotein translocase subunit SecE